jgi:hypothetical protein
MWSHLCASISHSDGPFFLLCVMTKDLFTAKKNEFYSNCVVHCYGNFGNILSCHSTPNSQCSSSSVVKESTIQPCILQPYSVNIFFCHYKDEMFLVVLTIRRFLLHCSCDVRLQPPRRHARMVDVFAPLCNSENNVKLQKWPLTTGSRK